MKNLILLTLSILFIFSCNSEEPETIFHANWSVDNQDFSIQSPLCKTSGWQGGQKSIGSDTTEYNTQSKIEDSENNKLLLDFHFIETDSSFRTLSKEKAIELLSPKKIDMSDFPNFYFRVVCEFDGKSYSNVVYDTLGVIISDDFQLTTESLDLEFSHDCLDGSPNLILEGIFSGTLTNQFDITEEIFIDNGDFEYLFIRY